MRTSDREKEIDQDYDKANRRLFVVFVMIPLLTLALYAVCQT